MKRGLARYRGKGMRYRPRSYRGRGSPYARRYSPYRSKLYNPNRNSPYRRAQESEVSEQQYSLPPETRYEPRQEKRTGEAEPEGRLLSRGEFFQRHPPNFPEHWNNDFRKDVMDRMYGRYVEFAIGKALGERIEAEKEEAAKKEEPEKPEVGNDKDFEQDPQDKLLEVIGEKGIDSPDGKATYEELLGIQLREINGLEDEYWKEKDEPEAGSSDSPQFSNRGTEPRSESGPQDGAPETERESAVQDQGQVKELSQAEANHIMDQLEGELFTEPEVELSEIEKADALAEQALQIDEAEIEDLVRASLEETKLESSELGAELEPEIGPEVEEDDQAEVY